MAKTVRIFKSFEEQEAYTLAQMSKTTPLEKFKNLYRMQLSPAAFIRLLINPAK